MVRLTALIGITVCVAYGQNQTGVGAALRLEAARAGACPTGWGCTQGGTVGADSEVVHTGKWSVRIAREPGMAPPFSTMTKSIPLDFTGKSVEWRGFIRTEDVKEFGALWIRTDGEDRPLGFATMQAKNPAKGTTEWTEYSVSLPVSAEARTLVFGFLLSGPGKAWLAEPQLLVDGKPVVDAPRLTRPKIPLDLDHEFDGGSKVEVQALSGVQISNLATLGRVWGFLKYHHQGIVAGTRHFDYDLLRVLPVILAAKDRPAANAAMTKWVADLGEITPCTVCARLEEKGLQMRPDNAWIADEKLLGKALAASLQTVRTNRQADGKQFTVKIRPGVGNPVFEHEPRYLGVRFPDAGFQILGLFRFWNIIQYWYPDRDVIGADWGEVLKEFVPRVGLAKDRNGYEREVMALVARVNDTHVNLWGSLGVRPPVGNCMAPVNVRFAEGRAVVWGYSNARLGEASGLRRGDVIEELDGVAVGVLVKQWAPMYAASNEPTRLRDMGRNLTQGDCGKPVKLRMRRGEEVLDVATARVSESELDLAGGTRHDRPGDTFQRLSPEVAYLKLSTVRAADAAKYVEGAAGAKGLIIDIRNYPAEFIVFALGQLVTNRPVDFAIFTEGDLVNPGAFHWGVTERLTPKEPQFKGKIVVVVDETSLSQSEFTAMAFRAMQGAVVVGSTTAGADGDVSQINLPGGLRTMISGIGVFYPDKRPTQRVGIEPDIEVKPTIQGILDGRDEVLEAAIREVVGPGASAEAIRAMAGGK